MSFDEIIELISEKEPDPKFEYPEIRHTMNFREFRASPLSVTARPEAFKHD